MMLKASLLVLVTALLMAGIVAGQDESSLGALPDEFSVYAVGVSQGETPVDIQLDDGGHQTTQADIEAWIDEASKPYKRFNPDLRVQSRMRVGRTYVVLDEFTLPNGLYGAHSRSFIIPRGVKIPRGPRCHNTFYRMDGTATGPGAHAE